MKAVICDAFDPTLRTLRVDNVPDPVPDKGEVLVSISVAAVNPADLMMISGTYIRDAVPPFVPGLVGVGHVVAHNAGIMGRLLLGRRVVFASTKGKGGTWAERAVAPAGLCIPLADDIGDEAGVNLLANAATAVGLIAEAQAGRHKAMIVTGAGGEVARSIAVAARAKGITVIGVVRRQAVADELAASGAFVSVVATDNEGWRRALRQFVAETKATLAIDAVAGAMTETLLDALPDGGKVIVLGRLSGEPISFDAMRQLIGRGMQVEGFSIDRWFAGRSLPAQLLAVRRATQLLKATGGTKPARTLSLDHVPAHLGDLIDGKTVIVPVGI